MEKRRNYHLTDEELEIVEKAMHHDKRPEVRPKAQVLHLLHQGYSVTQVARMMAVSRLTIYKWHDAWLESSIDGLARHKGSGRRRKATPEYEQLLEKTLETAPSELGYDFTVWTVDRLGEYLFEKTGIKLSDRTLNNTIKRLGYVYRRPKGDLTYLHDPEVMKLAESHLEMLKKKPLKEATSSSLWTRRR